MIDIGKNRECFFDDYLIDPEKTTAEFRVHNPVYRGPVMTHSEFWEGDGCDYHNFFYDDGIWRMYYLGWKMLDANDGIRVCYAESRDGLNWMKPRLGIVEYKGSKDNNIILPGSFDNFMVFKDGNPKCPPDKKYKAVAAGRRDGKNCLDRYFSADAVHFVKDEVPVTWDGAFDSLNVAFWDDRRQKYMCYFRGFHEAEGGLAKGIAPQPIRDIRCIESADFEHWSDFRLLDFGDAEDIPLYTNLVQPYYRAPQLYIGFPTRYIQRPGWNGTFDELCGREKRLARMEKSERYGLTVTDCVFMVSRDGVRFRRYDEAFMPPLPENGKNWVYGDCYPARGLMELPSGIPGADPELSIFAYDNHWMGEPARFVRYTIRLDGFVSLHAGAGEQAAVTKPFVYDGSQLRVNFSTSARGYMVFTLTGEDGTVIISEETFGNTTDRKVVFPDAAVASLSGRPVTLRVVMRDADLYSIRFA